MPSYPPPSVEPRGLDPQSSAVRTIAVVGVIFGTLGMSCLPFNFGAWITYGWPIEGSKTTAMDMWAFASIFIELGLATMLLLCSFATYHFKWWGRDGLLLWAVTTLAYGLCGIFFWGRFVLPWLNSEYSAIRAPDEVAGPIAWIIGSCLSLFVLAVMTRPSIRAVFKYPNQEMPAAHRAELE